MAVRENCIDHETQKIKDKPFFLSFYPTLRSFEVNEEPDKPTYSVTVSLHIFPSQSNTASLNTVKPEIKSNLNAIAVVIYETA